MASATGHDHKVQQIKERLAESGLLPSLDLEPASDSTDDTLDWLIAITERLCSRFEQMKGIAHQLEGQNSYLIENQKEGFSYDNIIGASRAMQHVFQLLPQVSFTNSTVLLLGETGTGKELIARAIHNSSGRHNQLMVKVNCAALPPDLVESELFGHEKGSFSGALQRRIGKFELASRGTLFLDEIGELPPDMQAKLLRAIQEREIERIGGKASIPVDLRIIAATNRDLAGDVARGRFRADLYYRLNVFSNRPAALRERRDDIVLLSEYFIARFSKKYGKKITKLSSKATKELIAYPWPGNVRELEHLIERSVLLTNSNVITDIHLPTFNAPATQPQLAVLFDKTHQENEKDYIIQILNKCNGKVYGPGGAAQALNLKVGTLNSKIKKLGIVKEQGQFKKADFPG